MAAACARHAVAIRFAPALQLDNGAVVSRSKDGFGSDMDEIRSKCHFLPYFNLDTENAMGGDGFYFYFLFTNSETDKAALLEL